MNPNLQLIGLLPTLVEPSACQQASLAELVGRHPSLLIPTSTGPNPYAVIPRHAVIAQAHADAQAMWERSDGAAQALWQLTEPSIAAVAARLTAAEVPA
jgi:chromosome partitioning protein